MCPKIGLNAAISSDWAGFTSVKSITSKFIICIKNGKIIRIRMQF